MVDMEIKFRKAVNPPRYNKFTIGYVGGKPVADLKIWFKKDKFHWRVKVYEGWETRGASETLREAIAEVVIFLVEAYGPAKVELLDFNYTKGLRKEGE